MQLIRSDSHIMTRRHFQEGSKNQIRRARSVPKVLIPSKSSDRILTHRGKKVSVAEKKGELWFVRKKNKKGREFLEFVIAQNSQKGFFNVKSYIDMQYSGRVPHIQFFDQLVKVFMGTEDTKKVGDLIYSSIPDGQELNFITNSHRALLRTRAQRIESTGSLGRETSLVSKLFCAHFLKLYGLQLDKLLLPSLMVLKEQCRESQGNKMKDAILNTVDSVLRNLCKETEKNIPYDIKRLYRQSYADCNKTIDKNAAQEQVVGNFFLIIVCPRLIKSRVPGKIKDGTSFLRARINVSKIIQHIANGTKPNSGDLSFAFEGETYQKRKEIVGKIINNLINLDQ